MDTDQVLLSPPPVSSVDKFLSSRSSTNNKKTSARTSSASSPPVSSSLKKRKRSLQQQQQQNERNKKENNNGAKFNGSSQRMMKRSKSQTTSNVTNHDQVTISTPYRKSNRTLERNSNKQTKSVTKISEQRTQHQTMITSMKERYYYTPFPPQSSSTEGMMHVGRIIFPTSSLFNNNNNDGMNSRSMNDGIESSILPFLMLPHQETSPSPSPTTTPIPIPPASKTNNSSSSLSSSSNSNENILLANQLIMLPRNNNEIETMNQSDHIQTWKFQSPQEHCKLTLSNKECKQIRKEISLTNQNTTTSGHDHLFLQQQDQKHDAFLNHGEQSDHSIISLPTMNMMLSTMNAGLILYNPSYYHDHSHRQNRCRHHSQGNRNIDSTERKESCAWWILRPFSLSKSYLIPLPFLSSTPPSPLVSPLTLSSMIKSQFVHPEQKSRNESQMFFENEVANDVKDMKKSINNQDGQNSSTPTPVSMVSMNQNSNGYSKQEETVKSLCIPEIIYDSNSMKRTWEMVLLKYNDFLFSTNGDDIIAQLTSFIRCEMMPLFKGIFLSLPSFNPKQDVGTGVDTLLHDNILEKLFRAPIPTNFDVDGKNKKDDEASKEITSIFMTKVQLTSCVRNRDTNKISQTCRRLLELQIIARVELYQFLYNETNREIFVKLPQYEVNIIFLRELYGCMVTGGKGKATITGKKKKAKKSKPFSSDDFCSEICSVIELIPFIIPNSESFADYLKHDILKPYNVSVGVVRNILDYFEIEIDDEELTNNGKQEDAPTIQIDGKKPRIDELNKKVQQSRWDKVESDEVILAENIEKESKGSESKKYKTEESKLLCKREIQVQPKSRNPLLANSRGTYVGRNLSNSFHHQVKIVPTNNKGKLNNSLSKKPRENEAKETVKFSGIENAEEIVQLNIKRDDKHKLKKPQSRSTLRTKKISIGLVHQSDKSKSSKRKDGLHGAAALAARAAHAMRKRVKNRKR